MWIIVGIVALLLALRGVVAYGKMREQIEQIYQDEIKRRRQGL